MTTLYLPNILDLEDAELLAEIDRLTGWSRWTIQHLGDFVFAVWPDA